MVQYGERKRSEHRSIGLLIDAPARLRSQYRRTDWNGGCMFCPSCGFEYTQKTNYCKRCGEELNASPQSVEIKPQRSQAIGMSFVVVAFLAIMGLFLNLLSFHVLLDRHDEAAAFISFALGLLFVGGIAGFLMRQLSRLITASQKP